MREAKQLGDAALWPLMKLFAMSGELEHHGVSSPIEAVMLYMFTCRFSGTVVAASERQEAYSALERGRAVIVPQHPAGPYQVDFGVIVPTDDGRILAFAIECDGHEYHQATHEQINNDRARERFLMANGWIVVRFTGSEIFQSPSSCLEQFQEIVDAHVRRQRPLETMRGNQ